MLASLNATTTPLRILVSGKPNDKKLCIELLVCSCMLKTVRVLLGSSVVSTEICAWLRNTTLVQKV
jgi:hypothetical protein